MTRRAMARRVVVGKPAAAERLLVTSSRYGPMAASPLIDAIVTLARPQKRIAGEP
jgi:hypothetical protein